LARLPEAAQRLPDAPAGAPGPEGVAPSVPVPEQAGAVGVRPAGKTIRLRDKEHLKFVAKQACLVCGREPSDAHHLRFAQPRALGRKVSDEFTVPVCRLHHRDLHQQGDEAAWWTGLKIDPVPIAFALWRSTHLYGAFNSPTGGSTVAVGFSLSKRPGDSDPAWQCPVEQ
jgi:hypothetical protein